MKTRTTTMLSSAIESATGVALLAVPDLVARVLLGTGLSDSGSAVARLAGCGLLSLGLACWPSGDEPTPNATRALFIYNLLAGFYLGYLRVGGGFVSFLLWPACFVHVALAVLLARPALRAVKPE
ncbi:MAG TPA: hypothetical protein VII23_00175 [Terriglobales bacterium]|jgi:hypothetical protein